MCPACKSLYLCHLDLLYIKRWSGIILCNDVRQRGGGESRSNLFLLVFAESLSSLGEVLGRQSPSLHCLAVRHLLFPQSQPLSGGKIIIMIIFPPHSPSWYTQMLVCLLPWSEWGIGALGSLQALFLYWCPEDVTKIVSECVREREAYSAFAMALASTRDEEEDDDFETSGVSCTAILSRRLLVCQHKQTNK